MLGSWLIHAQIHGYVSFPSDDAPWMGGQMDVSTIIELDLEHG